MNVACGCWYFPQNLPWILIQNETHFLFFSLNYNPLCLISLNISNHQNRCSSRFNSGSRPISCKQSFKSLGKSWKCPCFSVSFSPLSADELILINNNKNKQKVSKCQTRRLFRLSSFRPSLSLHPSVSPSLSSLTFPSNWSHFPPWGWWMKRASGFCPSTPQRLIKENIPWLPIFPHAWQPIILPTTWLGPYYAEI